MDSFNMGDFKFAYQDDIAKVFTIKKVEVVFEKSWLTLVTPESREEIEINPVLEKMYYDMSPYIIIRTKYRGLDISERLSQGSLEQSNDFFNKIGEKICAILYLGVITLTLE
jgi:hypothetical protein